MWSYEHESVVMATTGAPNWATGAREAIPLFRLPNVKNTGKEVGQRDRWTSPV